MVRLLLLTLLLGAAAQNVAGDANAVSGVGAAANEPLTTAVNGVTDAMNGVTAAANEQVNGVTNAMNGAGATANEQVNGVTGAISPGLNNGATAVTDAANAVADTAANQAGAAYNAVAKAAQDGKEGVAAAAAAAGAGATADDDEEAEVEEGTSHEHFIWEVVGVCAGAVGLTAGTQYLLSDEQRAKRQARMRHMKNRTAVESLKKEKEKEKREMGARTPQGSQPYAQQLPIQMSSGVQQTGLKGGGGLQGVSFGSMA
ncbi:unnamed protein product [Effrenium voratum]|nr:unnamed protein product [Effrenium voratum]